MERTRIHGRLPCRRGLLGAGLPAMLLLFVGPVRAEVRIQKMLEVPSQGATAIVVRHPLGALVVRGWTRPRLRIVANKRGPTQAAAQRLRVKVSLASGQVRVETRLLRRGGLVEAQRLREQAAQLSDTLQQRMALPKPWSPAVREEIARLQQALGEVYRSAFRVAAGRRVETSRLPGLAGARLDLTLYVPRGMAVTARTLRGDIDVAGLSGAVRLEARQGRIYARDVSGTVTTRADRGSQFLSAIQGSVDADGYDGDLQIRRVRGAQVVARLVRGNIRAQQVSGPSIRLSTTVGDVLVWATLPPMGRLLVRSLGGHISARVGAPAGFVYRLQTGSGRVRGPGHTAHHGRVGRGRGRVTLRTDRGDVSLRFQRAAPASRSRSAPAGTPRR